MMEEKKFLYSVNPRRVIKNIAGISAIRTSKSLFLTKDEVLECVKCGTVYRRFSGDNIQRVTPAELDRLHRDEYLTVEEFKKLNADTMGKDRGTTEEVKSTVDNKEANVDENISQGSVTSTQKDEKASETISEEPEAKDEIAENKSDSREDQVEATNESKEVDANDHASNSETTTVVNKQISVSDDAKATDIMSDQTTSDQVTDNKPSFQASSIQVNTSGKKKNKGK